MAAGPGPGRLCPAIRGWVIRGCVIGGWAVGGWTIGGRTIGGWWPPGGEPLGQRELGVRLLSRSRPGDIPGPQRRVKCHFQARHGSPSPLAA